MRLRWAPRLICVIGLSSCVYGQNARAFDRLEPVSPYSLRKDSVELYKLLIKEPNPAIWMIADSPFFAAYAITLKQLKNRNTGGSQTIFRLTLNRLSQPSWITLGPGKHGKKSPDGSAKMGLNSQVVEIPSSAAETILRAWIRGVQESRYRGQEFPPPPPSTHSYEFYAENGYFGKAWGPEPGMPSLMIELGNDLVSYVEANPSDREARLQICIEAARKVQTYSFNLPPAS